MGLKCSSTSTRRWGGYYFFRTTLLLVLLFYFYYAALPKFAFAPSVRTAILCKMNGIVYYCTTHCWYESTGVTGLLLSIGLAKNLDKHHDATSDG